MFSFLCLLAIIFATIYIAFIYESVAFMLLTFTEALFFVISFIYVHISKYAVKGRIEVPIGISETGKANMVKIVISNKNRFSVTRMKALIIVEDTITESVKKYWMKLSEIPQGEVNLTNNIVLPGTGNYVIMLKKLRIYDVTGLLYTDIVVKSAERVSVMPKLYDVPVKLTEATKNFYGESDVYDEHSPGQDKSGLFQVRTYQKGDRLQNIHWKMTAKQDEIMVKEHLLPKSCPVVFFLDFHPIKKSKKSKRETYFLEAAVSISFSMMDAGCSHYIVWYDKDTSDIIRVRVDDEESLFCFIDMLMKARWEMPKDESAQRYREKYRNEPYVWTVSLDENLVLKRNEEILIQLSERDLENSLSKVELFL